MPCGPGTDQCRGSLSVVEAARGRWQLGMIPVDVGIAEPEAELLVEVVGRYPRGAGGQVDAASALLLRQVNRGHGQGCAHAVAAGVLFDNDMFDRIASSGRAVRQPGMLGWRSSRVPASGSGG